VWYAYTVNLYFRAWLRVVCGCFGFESDRGGMRTNDLVLSSAVMTKMLLGSDWDLRRGTSDVQFFSFAAMGREC